MESIEKCGICNRRTTTFHIADCPIKGLKRKCPCRNCIVRPMCMDDCGEYMALRAEIFKIFLDKVTKLQAMGLKYKMIIKTKEK